jgi:hypothetical protein
MVLGFLKLSDLLRKAYIIEFRKIILSATPMLQTFQHPSPKVGLALNYILG